MEKKDYLAKISEESGVPQEEIAGVFTDEKKKQRLIFTRSQLKNQLQNECPKINSSFDSIYEDELKDISSEMSEIMPILYLGHKEAVDNSDELLICCGHLLRNASTTLMSSVHCLRSGFKLQRGILLRSVVEMCASATHLFTNSSILQDFKNDKIKSTASISVADKQVPIFGKIWGILSNNHIHINTMHTEWYPMQPFSDKSDIPTEVTIGIIGTVMMVLRITTELINHDIVDDLNFWERISETELKFLTPNEDKTKWILEKLDQMKSKL